jgi:hypothetical protein
VYEAVVAAFAPLIERTSTSTAEQKSVRPE